MDILTTSEIVDMFAPMFLFSASFLLVINTLITIIYLKPVLSVLSRGIKEIVIEIQNTRDYFIERDRR